MKGLKKLALVTAVAAAPFAQAEMTAMDDALLGEMTGQAGITIDVDLAMTIDAIKYVDRDGNQDGSGVQGAITMSKLAIGDIAADGTLSAATIRGITIDADGTDGLVIGLNQIGDTAGNGIDITVDAVIIGNGYANLAQTEAGVAIATSTQTGAAATAAVTDGAYADGAAYGAALAAGDPTAIGYLAAADATVAAAVAKAQSGAQGNIGGFKVENFRNYIQDDLVNEYNGVFDMALQDSTGNVGGVTGAPGSAGRFVRGEIVINGTGNVLAGTSGLNISGKFGGAMDQAAWVDEGNEFGIEDLGFFNGVDENGDGISDVIEGMHFTMNIDVVQHESWNAATPGTDDVAALRISGLEMEGTIMMGSIYLDGDNTVYDTDGVTVLSANTINKQSLGSVLIKDIDMTGTSVYIYGH
ncbi:MAG: hypothetical protein HWE18_09440 [Gammaproteobacteria bacterium]|nr:hypothetical protein [Gammaproteobacteria bacterium]